MEQHPLAWHSTEEEEGPRIERYQFGSWLFNVNGARTIIEECPRELRILPVEVWAYHYGLDETDGGASLFSAQNLDRDYAMTTNLDKPLIVATMRSSEHREFHLLIDGTHRLYKAHIEGVSELPVYVLDAAESLSIREDYPIGNARYWPSREQQSRPDVSTEGGDDGS